MTIRAWALAALFALLPLAAEASNCNSNPFTLTNGQTADATQVMANFNNLLNCANNNLAHNAANSDITSLSGLTTPLSVPQGGSGAATFTANGVLLGNATSAFQAVAPLTNGNLLTSNGTTWIATGATLSSIVDGANGGLQFTLASPTVTAILSPSNLLTKTTPLTADSFVILDASSATLAGKRSTMTQVQAVPGWAGGIIKGNTNSPSVTVAKASGGTSVAHGLGRQPDYVFFYLQNIVSELGYSVGDRSFAIPSSTGGASLSVSWDATNTTIQAQNVTMAIPAKTTGVLTNIAPGSWNIVAVPVIFNGFTF